MSYATVRWMDSMVVKGEHDVEAVEAMQAARMETAGHLAALGKLVVVIAQDVVRCGDEPLRYRNLIVIPRECILEIRVMNEGPVLT